MQTKKRKRATDSPNVQKSLIWFAKNHAKEQKEQFGKYLKEQFQTSMDKEKNARQKLLDKRIERYLDAMFCLHLYHSPICQRSAAQARQEFAVLGYDIETATFNLRTWTRY